MVFCWDQGARTFKHPPRRLSISIHGELLVPSRRDTEEGKVVKEEGVEGFSVLVLVGSFTL